MRDDADWKDYLAKARKRRAKVLASYRAGDTVDAISKAFSISRTRVWQIIATAREETMKK